MLEKLFSSRGRVKILTLFMMNPGEDFFLREISRLTHENLNSISRELQNLEDIGLLESKKQGNMKYFSINQDYPIYPELRNIIMKTEGVSKSIKEILSRNGDIKIAFIYGSFASGEADQSSDLDIFLMGNIDEDQLLRELSKLEGEVGREINYVLFNSREVEKRIDENDPFILNVWEGPKIMLIGDLVC